MKAIARVHKQIFADHLLGRLPVWLIRQYYTCLFKAGAIAIVAERDTDGIIGFILGGNGRSLAVGKRDFLKRWGALFGGCIMMDRVALRLFWETYVRLKKATSPQSVVGTSFSMRLLSIGVCKQSQGSGIASELLAYFENVNSDLNKIHYDKTHRVNLSKQIVLQYMRTPLYRNTKADNELNAYCESIKYLLKVAGIFEVNEVEFKADNKADFHKTILLENIDSIINDIADADWELLYASFAIIIIGNSFAFYGMRNNYFCNDHEISGFEYFSNIWYTIVDVWKCSYFSRIITSSQVDTYYYVKSRSSYY